MILWLGLAENQRYCTRNPGWTNKSAAYAMLANSHMAHWWPFIAGLCLHDSLTSVPAARGVRSKLLLRVHATACNECCSSIPERCRARLSHSSGCHRRADFQLLLAPLPLFRGWRCDRAALFVIFLDGVLLQESASVRCYQPHASLVGRKTVRISQQNTPAQRWASRASGWSNAEPASSAGWAPLVQARRLVVLIAWSLSPASTSDVSIAARARKRTPLTRVERYMLGYQRLIDWSWTINRWKG